MGAGRWAVAGGLFALACAGKSTSQDSSGGPHSDAGGDPPTGTECKTSFACPTGTRCDEGTCVPDDDCPDARDPELLFEAPAGSPWSAYWNQYFTVLNGREHLVLNEVVESSLPTELSRFLDLRTGRELQFVHEAGWTSCGGTPARCEFTLADAAITMEIELDRDTVRMREGTRFEFAGNHTLFGSDADYRDGRIIVVSGPLVELWELGGRIPIAAINLADRRVLDILVGADGRSERVLSWKQENVVTGEASENVVTALENGALPTLIYSGPGGALSAVLAMPAGDHWYVLRDDRTSGESLVHVYRSDGAVTHLGTLDVAWAIGVDHEYRTGEHPLEPGPSAYVRHCEESGCGSYRFFLDPVGLEEVGRVPLPEPGLLQHHSRRIACGGADFWVVTQTGDEPRTRYWSLRVPGRAGFP